LDEIKKGDEVYIYSLSRIARDTLQNLWIEREIVKAGAKIYSVKEDFEQTPEAVMMRTILSAFATYEREMIKARTAAAKRTYRSQFKYCGGKREYGFEVVDGKMVENKEEQQVIGKIKEWKSAGDKIVDIQRKLNDAGIPSATGKEWSYERLRILVKRVA
jgi:DNA invertase Pin-like site-specific DNA recombinase